MEGEEELEERRRGAFPQFCSSTELFFPFFLTWDHATWREKEKKKKTGNGLVFSL